MEIFIPGNVPSLKNSKIKTNTGIFHSKTVTKYLRSLNIQNYSTTRKTIKGYVSKDKPNLFKEVFDKNNIKKITTQTEIYFHFVRKSKHKFDFVNAVQIICDLMVAHDYIEDDNMDYLIPIPYKKDDRWYSYNKEFPGVYIRIL